MPPKKASIKTTDSSPQSGKEEKVFWDLYRDQLADFSNSSFIENNELLPEEMVEAYECEAPLTVGSPGDAISLLYRISNERSSFTPFMPINLIETVQEQYGSPQHIFEGDDTSTFSIDNDFYKTTQDEIKQTKPFTFSHPDQSIVSSFPIPIETADEETQSELKKLSLEMLSTTSIKQEQNSTKYNLESTEPLFFDLPETHHKITLGTIAPNGDIKLSNYFSQIISIEPEQIGCFDEGHLTSTSDFLELPDVNEDEIIADSKGASTESQEITLSSHSHTKSRDPGIQIEYPQQTTIHNRFLNPSFLKASARAKAAEKNMAARFQAAIGSSGQMPRSTSFPKKSEPQRKPLQNCCVAAANGGIFRPLFTVFDGPGPKIYWASFPGLHLSPFEPPPVNSEEYLRKQKKKQEAAIAPQPEEAIQMNFCEICKVKFENAQTHRESRLHQERAAQIDWREMDNLFSKLNKDFRAKF